MKRFLLSLLLLAAFGLIAYWLGEQAGKRAQEQEEAAVALPHAAVGVGEGDAVEGREQAKTPPKPTTFTPETEPALVEGAVPLLERLNEEYATLTRAVIPSVVNIVTVRKSQGIEMFLDEGGRIPFGPRGEDGGPSGPPPLEASSVGSGVIISHEGHIVSNSHVVKDAERIEVQLADGRRLDADVVGSDDPADIAVLKIDATDLQPLKWGDSSKVRVGEQVFAIGNPLGQTDSVSNGIVSALGRNPQITQGNYEDFIQTNAAINPGNSGGALVNIRGELIGINTAIASTSRGFQGIGFAIPSNHARFALESLLKTGRVVRGYLGVAIRNITPEWAPFYGLKDDRGALVENLGPDTPAAQGGIKVDDVIVSFDGRKILDSDMLRLVVSQTPIGREVPVTVLRDGQPKELTVTIAEQPQDFAGMRSFEVPTVTPAPPVKKPDNRTTADNALAGITVQNLDDEERAKWRVGDKVRGVVISEVEPNSVAARERLQPGDVIEGIRLTDGKGTRRVTDVATYLALANQIKKDDSVLLRVNRGGTSVPLVLKGADGE